MTDALLKSLRDQVLDEAEPLAGLLRKCLLLGAETGSVSLRLWARKELNGYDEGDELPNYRKLPTPPITADTVSGNSWATNMTYNVLQLPSKAREAIGDTLPLHQPLEELEKVAAQKSMSFTSAGMAYAQHVWNESLPPFQEIANLRFTVSGSIFAGVLGKIRTQLVDVVADLTASTPLAELPRKELVDAAVGTHIGTQYNTTIHAANGTTAIGDSATAKSEGLDIDDVVKLLDAVRDAFTGLHNGQMNTELLEAVEELEQEIQTATPNTGTVVRKAGRLKSVAAKVGDASLNAAVSGALGALTTLIMSGTFG